MTDRKPIRLGLETVPEFAVARDAQQAPASLQQLLDSVRVTRRNFQRLERVIEEGILSGRIIDESSHGDLNDLGEDDHAQYQLRSEQGHAAGYPTLDGEAVVDEPVRQLKVDTFANRPVSASEGEVFVASDTDELYIWLA